MKNKETIIVLGGGLSGLAAAERLVKKYNVIVLEKDKLLGGAAKSFFYKEKWIPITYHHIMSVDSMTLNYIKKFGLFDKLFWKNVGIAFWFNGKPYPLTQPYHILTFDPFNFFDKLRLIKFGIYCYLKSDWNNLRGTRAHLWLRDFVGEKITNSLFEKLAEIKFGALSSVDIAWFGSRLHEAARNREKYSYLTVGIHELVARLTNYIKDNNGKIHLNMEVTKIQDGHIEAVDKNGAKKSFEADKIISSIPPQVLAGISDLPKTVKNKLKKIRYKSVICMVVSSNNLISKHYWNVFINPRFSFGGIFNHTILYPKGGIDGKYLYYAFTFVDKTDELYKLSEEQIKQIYLEDIRKISPDFKPLWTKIFKINYATPYYSFNYENPPIKISDKIYLTGTYREHPTTRTMHTALTSGNKTAEYILREDVL